MRQVVLAAVLVTVGAVIILAGLSGGVGFSWPLLLGALILADGVLRLLSLPRDGV